MKKSHIRNKKKQEKEFKRKARRKEAKKERLQLKIERVQKQAAAKSRMDGYARAKAKRSIELSA